jgi:hypothetical protein
VLRFPNLFRRRCEKLQPDPFLELIDKAYYKGVRDTLIAIAWEIIRKSIKPGEDMANVYVKLYETAWNLEKYSKMIECIASDGVNEQRFKCIANVMGLKNTREHA